MTARSLTVAALLDSRPGTVGLPLELLGGAQGLDRTIGSPHIQKTGLALVGFHDYLQPARVLVFGESEIRYLESLSPEARTAILTAGFAHDIPCVLLTGGIEAPIELVQAAEAHRMPLLRTPVATPLAIARIGSLLDDALAVRQLLHGVLLEVLGLGVLLLGDSGIGKSECALDLIVRGHRLIADDAVEVRRRGEMTLFGTCPELTRHHMEIRGLGVLNIGDLFGVASTRASKRVELVVRLERWDPAREYDRLGLDDNAFELFGVRVPLIEMPVAPGRNLAILVEVAARNQLLRARGLNAARDLAARLDAQLGVQADDEAEGGEGGA
jgi:HPr kinase/phosphorylase